jgi:2-polyprenyl-6-methoxyphenol hydroxylase-like FAD-dependent oxidoreductase
LLADAAVAAGAHLVQASAMPAQVGDEDVWVPLGDGRRVHAKWLVLAHGRRAGGPSIAPRTAALYAYWEGAPLADPRTRVEAAPHAWYWGAPLPDGSFNATVFVDAQRCAGLRPMQRESWYRELVGASALLRDCLRGRLRTEVQVCDATPRRELQPVQERVLKVGEAAFSIDPLSSQGVQAAMRSGWQAAACVHTAAHRPASQALAAAFHAHQTERAAAHHARLAAEFHAVAARRFDTPFWQRRAAGFTPAPAAPALPRLEVWVKLDPRARLAPAPALEGDFVVQAEALHHPALDGPVSQAGALSMPRLLQRLREPLPVSDLLRGWRHDCGESGAVQLFSQLWRQGVVVPASA